jgi:hypothetical protein
MSPFLLDGPPMLVVPNGMADGRWADSDLEGLIKPLTRHSRPDRRFVRIIVQAGGGDDHERPTVDGLTSSL